MSGVYIAPESLSDVLAAVAGGARPIAGGTDLVVGARHGKAPLPDSLCAIHRVRELAGIRDDGRGGLVLGALVSHADITAHPLIRGRFSGLADASAIVGSHATRNTGTIGGNVMNGSPAMDTGAPLICAGAVATLASSRGTREVAVADLFIGPGRTSGEADELLTSVLLPAPAEGTGSCYVRLEYRRQMEIAIVGVGCQVTVGGDGRIRDARIAITALAPTIHRIADAEALLDGSDGSSETVHAAGDAVAAASRPISDVRGSDRYRRAMAAVIARRAIGAALVRARGGEVLIPASQALHGAVEV
jgi:CO/xanthine dehydrogenase FAD-binding subunit